MSEQSPPAPPKPRPRFDPIAFGGGRRGAALVVYGVIVAAMVGFGLYMSVVEKHAFTSPYVAGPAIGALWFSLRLFMIFSSRK